MSNPSNITVSQATLTFLQCVSQLLNSQSSPEARRIADEWLGKFQFSWEAWNVVDEVLNYVTDDLPLFLAAQTLNRKVRYDCEQLGKNEANWNALRAKLVTHLMKHSNRHIVCTQLSLALVALTIEMETWTGAIPELVKVLQPNPSVLLEVLRLLPEEVDDSSIDVSASRRYSFKNEMIDSGAGIIQVLASVANNSPPRLLLRCLASWIAYSDLPSDLLVKSTLFFSSYHSLITHSY